MKGGITTTIFHIDVNNAFLSWESVYRLTRLGETLDLRTIPSAIGGNKQERHGIILAKSTPAKKLGIKTAETLGDALKKCPNLLIVSPHMDIYKTYSNQLMHLLEDYSDTIEQYSIDEAFVNMTGTELLFGTPEEAAHTIQNRIRKDLGFTVNIGISTNKLLAKMASDYPKPDTIYTIFPDEISTKLWPKPVGDLFFVGRASRKKLYNLGICTIGELAHTDVQTLRQHLGKHGDLIHAYANGLDTSPVLTHQPDNKGYGNSTTISHDVTDVQEAKQYILGLCESVGTRLRRDHVCAGVLAISLRDYEFHHGSHQCTLASATNVTSELYQYACDLFDAYWDGTPIRQIGVHSSKVVQDAPRQLNLLDGEHFIRQEKVEHAVDEIRQRFGKDAIKRASFLNSDNKKTDSF